MRMGGDEAYLGRAHVPSQKQQVGSKPPPAAAVSSPKPRSAHRHAQAARHASQQQQCRGVTVEENKRPREREAGRAPPARTPCHLGHHQAHTALGIRTQSEIRQVREERMPRHCLSVGACELPLPYRPALKRAPPTRQGCTPVAKSAAAKPDACKSNFAFTLAHVVYLVEYTARAAHVTLRRARGRVGGGGGGGGEGEGS